MNKRKSKFITGSLFYILCVLVVLICPFIGMKFIDPASLLSDHFNSTVFFNIRLPRMILAFLAGSGLAVCGMVFQALFRNPLADPYTLGVSSGASFGAALMIVLHVSGRIFGIPVIMLGAFAGAAASMGLVYGFSSLRQRMSGLTMLLAGVSVSFMFSSLLMFVQYISDMRHSFQIIRWLMGGLEVFGYEQIWPVGTILILCVLIIFSRLVNLDHLLAGEDLAQIRGINVKQTKILLFFTTSILVSSIVSVCGPIGFIGMMSPHICRLFFGHRHRSLGISSFVFGGAFLVVCDTFARTVIAPAEIPAGVITALLGGPFFLLLLFRHIRNPGSTIW